MLNRKKQNLYHAAIVVAGVSAAICTAGILVWATRSAPDPGPPTDKTEQAEAGRTPRSIPMARVQRIEPADSSMVLGDEVMAVSSQAMDSESLSLDPRELCAGLAEALLKRDHETAAACRNALLTLGDSTVPMLKELLVYGNTTVETEAVKLLVRLGSPQALVAALDRVMSFEGEQTEQDLYTAAFSECRSDTIINWLVDQLGRTTRDDERARILAMLSRMRGESLIVDLAFHTEDPFDDLHSEDCAKVLRDRRSAGDGTILQELFMEADRPASRRILAEALANVGTPSACRFLIVRAEEEDDHAEACREAIPHITSTYAQEALLAAAYNRRLSAPVRVAIVSALGSQDSTRVQASLRTLHSAEDDTSIIEAIEAGLEEIERADDGMGETGEKGNEVWFR